MDLVLLNAQQRSLLKIHINNYFILTYSFLPQTDTVISVIFYDLLSCTVISAESSAITDYVKAM